MQKYFRNLFISIHHPPTEKLLLKCDQICGFFFHIKKIFFFRFRTKINVNLFFHIVKDTYGKLGSYAFKVKKKKNVALIAKWFDVLHHSTHATHSTHTSHTAHTSHTSWCCTFFFWNFCDYSFSCC